MSISTYMSYNEEVMALISPHITVNNNLFWNNIESRFRLPYIILKEVVKCVSNVGILFSILHTQKQAQGYITTVYQPNTRKTHS